MGFHGRDGEITVTVKRLELLERLKKNREQHGENYKKAYADWQQDIFDTVRKVSADFGKVDDIHSYPKELSDISGGEPSSYVKQYDRVIDMFEMSVSDTIELTQDSFNTYCRDEWDFQRNLLSNKYHSTYIGG